MPGPHVPSTVEALRAASAARALLSSQGRTQPLRGGQREQRLSQMRRMYGLEGADAGGEAESEPEGGAAPRSQPISLPGSGLALSPMGDLGGCDQDIEEEVHCQRQSGRRKPPLTPALRPTRCSTGRASWASPTSRTTTMTKPQAVARGAERGCHRHKAARGGVSCALVDSLRHPTPHRRSPAAPAGRPPQSASAKREHQVDHRARIQPFDRAHRVVVVPARGASRNRRGRGGRAGQGPTSACR